MNKYSIRAFCFTRILNIVFLCFHFVNVCDLEIITVITDFDNVKDLLLTVKDSYGTQLGVKGKVPEW